MIFSRSQPDRTGARAARLAEKPGRGANERNMCGPFGIGCARKQEADLPPFDSSYRPRLADLHPLRAPAMLAPSLAPAPVTTPPADLAGRTGYDTGFLGDFMVELPTPSPDRAGDVLQVEGSTGGRLDYTHFTVVMSKSRRFALFTAVNIDGGASTSVHRGDDHWAFDGRIPEDAQSGDALYADNDFDRGHLVRREDPNWGDMAATANADTFHFTNCTPQLAAFNQTTWLSLEDFILSNTRRWQERATVFTGPVLKADDPAYRDRQIPLAYWKVVAFLSDDGKPSASAYMIEQDVDLGRESLIFGPFKTYQRSVLTIESLTGLQFGALSGYDGFSNEERATGDTVKRTIHAASDILL